MMGGGSYRRFSPVSKQIGTANFGNIRTEFNSALAANNVERSAGQKDHRQTECSRIRMRRKAPLQKSQALREFPATAIHFGAFLEFEDITYGFGKIGSVDDRFTGRILARPDDQSQRCADTDVGFSVQPILPDDVGHSFWVGLDDLI